MFLSEEYYHRHGIEIPLVRHVQRGHVFFRKTTSRRVQWRILGINYRCNFKHPSNYDISVMKPRHNGYRDSMFDIIDTVTIPWDKYEEYLLNIEQYLDMDDDGETKVVQQSNELYLVTWEMLAFCADEAMSSHVTNDEICDVLDINKSVEERYAAHEKAIQKMQRWRDGVWSCWEGHFTPFLNDYCFWLADLIGNLCAQKTCTS
jgi:hypothetical protein